MKPLTRAGAFNRDDSRLWKGGREDGGLVCTVWRPTQRFIRKWNVFTSIGAVSFSIWWGVGVGGRNVSQTKDNQNNQRSCDDVCLIIMLGYAHAISLPKGDMSGFFVPGWGRAGSGDSRIVSEPTNEVGWGNSRLSCIMCGYHVEIMGIFAGEKNLKGTFFHKITPLWGSCQLCSMLLTILLLGRALIPRSSWWHVHYSRAVLSKKNSCCGSHLVSQKKDLLSIMWMNSLYSCLIQEFTHQPDAEQWIIYLTVSLPSSKSSFSQPRKKKCISEVSKNW